MLDDFSTVKIEETADKASQPASAGPSASTPKSGEAAPKEAAAAGEEPFSEEEFAKQLQTGMADLLGELEQSVCCQLELTECLPHELTIVR